MPSVRSKLERFYPFLSFIIPFLVFLSNMDGNWVLDDHSHLENNPYIRSAEHIPKILTSKVWDTTSSPGSETDIYRPVVFLSWLANYYMTGLSPKALHVSNNFIHGANALLVYLIAAMFLAPGFALFAALVFGLHPIVTEAVTWMSSRQDPLLVFFSLLCLLSLLKWSGDDKPNKRIMYLLIFALSIPLGVFSKEGFVFVPFAIIFAAGISSKNLSEAKKLILPFVLSLILISFAWVWRMHVVQGTDYLPKIWIMLYNFSSAVLRFFHLFLIPTETDFVHVYEMKPFSVAGTLTALMPLAFCLAVFVLCAGKRLRSIGISLFLASLLPVALVVDVTGLISERYFYLSLAGLSFFIASLTFGIYERYRLRSRWITLLVLIWILTLSAATVLRNRQWKDERTIYESSIVKDPSNHRAYYFLAWHFARKGDRAEEIKSYEEVLRLKPNDLQSLNNLAVRMIELKDWDKANEYLSAAFKINPKRAKTSYNIGCYHEAMGNVEEAVKWYKRALMLDPGYSMPKRALKRLDGQVLR